jgi:ubiquitin-protein ligase
MKAYQVIKIDWDIIEERWETVENVIETFKSIVDCLAEASIQNKISKEHSKFYIKETEVK